MWSLVELVVDAAIWTDIAKGFAEASPARRVVWLLELIGTGVLVIYLFGAWSEWGALAVIVVVVTLDFAVGKLIGARRDSDEGEAERVLSPEEIRVRAAAERAERELALRGTHPLGHPGGGGRLSD
jgi:hypothetical protein